MDTPAPAAVTIRALGPSLGLLIVAILLAAASIGWTYLQVQQATQQHKQAQARQSETRARLARVNEDEREIREKIARYHDLVQRGFTEPERRLQWVETLKAIKESRRLLGLNYEIAPQRPLDPKQVSSGGYDFLVSTMKLDLPMLHEEDLLGLLSDLSAKTQALVSVKSCQIERVTSGAQAGANLKAACEIDWIKLQEKR
jgi:type II secretory pathway pseudopilin PulG